MFRSLVLATLCSYLLGGCTRTTELLPSGDSGTADQGGSSFAFCPTSIDIYGGVNVQLVGCGGPFQAPQLLENGYFSVGSADYDATLAGRLLARLAADPDLVPRFGAAWKVRSCSTTMETLVELAPPLAGDNCGPDTPPHMGDLQGICTVAPAPLILVSADALSDHCHGGGPDSSRADDEMMYARHFAERLDALLATRAPQLAVVGARTEWVVPAAEGPPPNCRWQRPDWNITGLARWQESHSAAATVVAVGNLHEEFKRHSACCQALGLACATNWFSLGAGGPEAVNCDGAHALVDFWYAHLKDALLGNRFECP